MTWYYRIGAGIVFGLCLINLVVKNQPVEIGYLIAGQLFLILAEICNLEETIENDRNTEHDCDRDRGSN